MLSIHEKLLKFLSAVGFICLNSAISLTSPWDEHVWQQPKLAQPRTCMSAWPSILLDGTEAWVYLFHFYVQLSRGPHLLPPCCTRAPGEEYRLNNLTVEPRFVRGKGHALEVGVK